MIGLTRIILRLARNIEAGYPEGDDRFGYVLVAPLRQDGKIDLETWQENRARCTVRRFGPSADMEADGWLTKRGQHWRIHYDQTSEGPDEELDHLADHRLFQGDYVTITSPLGEALVYRVAETEDA